MNFISSSSAYLSLCSGLQLCNRHFLKMASSVSSNESCGLWKRIKCSRDELRLDVTLASGQSFRLVSCAGCEQFIFFYRFAAVVYLHVVLLCKM